MLQAKCKTKCSYGEAGEVVELKQDKLTKRQEVMLELYEAPKVKKLDEQKKTDKK
jgi:hypothetical protein